MRWTCGSAALYYQRGAESAGTFAAKRWVPWLAAYTGARVGKLAQLRKQDVAREGEHWIIRLTPDAGTIKTNEARTVVLHPHLVELGFPAFVGPLRSVSCSSRSAKMGTCWVRCRASRTASGSSPGPS